MADATDDPVARILAYHEATKHSPETVRRRFHPLDWDNKPHPFKVYPGLERVPLPEDVPPVSVPALEAIGVAEVRDPAPGLDLAGLARILVRGAGVHHTRPLGGDVYHFRNYASAGALYPVEIYLACNPWSRQAEGESDVVTTRQVRIVQVQGQRALNDVVAIHQHLMVLLQIERVARLHANKAERARVARIDVPANQGPLLPHRPPCTPVRGHSQPAPERLTVRQERRHELEIPAGSEWQIEAVEKTVDEVVEQRTVARRRRGGWRKPPGFEVVTGRVGHPSAQSVRRVAEAEGNDARDADPAQRHVRERIREPEPGRAPDPGPFIDLRAAALPPMVHPGGR